jgi:hypothetical protein
MCENLPKYSYFSLFFTKFNNPNLARKNICVNCFIGTRYVGKETSTLDDLARISDLCYGRFMIVNYGSFWSVTYDRN